MTGLAQMHGSRSELEMRVRTSATHSFARRTRRSRFLVAMPALYMVVLSAYILAPYIHYSITGATFPPHPKPDTIRHITSLGILALILHGVLLMLSGVSSSFVRALEFSVIYSRRHLAAISNSSLIALCTLLVSPFVALDWYKVLTYGVINIIQLPRRAFASELYTASDHRVQVILVACSVPLIAGLMDRKNRTAVVTSLSLAIMLIWMPYIMVGARKELAIAIVAAFIMSSGNIHKTRAVIAGLLFLGYSFVRAAADSSALSLDMVAHEWVLPMYVAFTIAEHHFTGLVDEMRHSIWNGPFFLVPSIIRPVDITDLGTLYKAMQWSNVGYGFHPVAEAWLIAKDNLWMIAPWYWIIPFATAIVLRRVLPSVPVFMASHLMVWGRSDLWVTLFFVVYEALVFQIVLRTSKLISGRR